MCLAAYVGILIGIIIGGYTVTRALEWRADNTRPIPIIVRVDHATTYKPRDIDAAVLDARVYLEGRNAISMWWEGDTLCSAPIPAGRLKMEVRIAR